MERKTKFSVESDMDKCVDALAEVKAYCTWCRNTGICKSSSCRTCNKQVYFNESLSRLIPLDRLRVDMLAFHKLQDYMQTSKPLRGMKYVLKGTKYILLIVLTLMVLPAIVPMIMMIFAKDTVGVPPEKYDDMVRTVIVATHKNVYDMDGDRAINCQDYTIMFKWQWEQMYPLYKNNVQITHNLNWKVGMNHLFITLFADDGRYYIEPQGTPDRYIMKDVWGNDFDPGKNKICDRNFWFRLMGLL